MTRKEEDNMYGFEIKCMLDSLITAILLFCCIMSIIEKEPWNVPIDLGIASFVLFCCAWCDYNEAKKIKNKESARNNLKERRIT